MRPPATSLTQEDSVRRHIDFDILQSCRAMTKWICSGWTSMSLLDFEFSCLMDGKKLGYYIAHKKSKKWMRFVWGKAGAGRFQVQVVNWISGHSWCFTITEGLQFVNWWGDLLAPRAGLTWAIPTPAPKYNGMGKFSQAFASARGKSLKWLKIR